MIKGAIVTTPRAAASRLGRSTRGVRPRRRLLLAICFCIGGALPGAAIGAPAAQAAAPLNGSAPVISGTAVDGKRLKVSKGDWEGSRPISYAYRWARCDASGASCVDIPAALKPTYKLTHADVGHAIRATVGASDSGGEGSAEAQPSEVVAPASLKKGKRPAVGGVAKDGQVLSVGNGTWKGTPPQSFAYQWQACTRSGACTDIPGATGSSYRIATAQIGTKLRALVTATNAVGKASAVSRASKPAVAGPPVELAAPAVSGDLQEGQTLSATPGGWAGTAPISYSYQWLRCSIAGGGCHEIAGATNPTYTAAGADLASNLAVVVTATNAQGSAPATSPETQPILGILPTNSVLPSISGLLQDGQLLSVATGVWSGTEPILYSYQWQLCGALGAGCEDLAGATGSSLKLDPGEIGKTLQVVVTATNSAGSSSVTTPLTSLIAGLVPVNNVLPSITGLLQDGGLLSIATGSWSGSEPISYAYQWQLCSALGEACKAIEGATGSSLKLDPGEIGKTLAVVVTATNAAGSSSATSSVTTLISGILPKSTTLPSISGALVDGQLLSVAKGAWTGSEPISYSYQWQLCNASGASCNNISEAVGSTLKLSSLDVGKTLAVVVTATNAAGSTSATSAASGLISALLPSNTALPTIGGLLKNGALLTAGTGSWAGTTPITFGYQWQLCTALGTGCLDIAKATSSTFLLGLLDVGGTLRAIVTATNSAGSRSATSAVTGLIAGLGLSPTSGPSGTTVRLSGNGVNAATKVDFGTAEASEVEVNSPTEITAEAPAGSGTVPVTVTTPEGSTQPNQADEFTYR